MTRNTESHIDTRIYVKTSCGQKKTTGCHERAIHYVEVKKIIYIDVLTLDVVQITH
jgi:hypothetical protein